MTEIETGKGIKTEIEKGTAAAEAGMMIQAAQETRAGKGKGAEATRDALLVTTAEVTQRAAIPQSTAGRTMRSSHPLGTAMTADTGRPRIARTPQKIVIRLDVKNLTELPTA